MTTVSAPTTALRMWRVLLIDDSPDDRAEIRRLLLRGSERRYKLAEAETGAAGVRAVLDAGDLPDCVVLDYNLPDMDAVEVLAALAGPAGLTACPVVVLTGTVGHEQTRAVLRAGAQDYLGKGWMTPESLTRAVENAAERWAMARELQDRDAALRETNQQLQMSLSVGRAIAFTWDIPSNEVRRPYGLASYLDATTGRPDTFEEICAKVHPDDRDPFERRVRQAIERPGRGYTNDYRMVGPDGSVRWISDTGRVEFSAEGKPLRLVGLATDITERKVAEEALRASEELNRSLMDGSLDCIKVLDMDGRLRHINAPGLCLMEIDDFGPLCGQAWSALWPVEAREDVQRAVATACGGSNYSFRAFCPTAKGTPRWWDVAVSPVRDVPYGPVMRLLSVSREITARKLEETALKASEVRYRRLFESAKDGILILDAHAAAITDANPFIAEMLGYSQDEFVGKELWQIGLFKDVEASKAAMRELQEEGYIRYEDLLLETKTGRRINVEFVSNVYGEDDEAVIQCNIRDISDRRRLEESLRQHAADLVDADRRKDEFLATLAHELRNPLAPIRNGLQIMRLMGNDRDAVEQTRTMMERQLGQMVHLVDDLLDVSRISQGKLELRKQRIELATVLNTAVETARPLIEAGGHELTIVAPPQPVSLDADLTRLGQVFSNLLNNAAKYSERGGRIRLAAERQGNDVVVSVKDTGVGIPPEMLPKIFDMFTQVDRSLEKSQGGLGIGLCLVKRLVEMHGGSVEAKSEGHGKGSEFFVRLPVVLSAAREVGPPTDEDEPACPSGKRRILVADDNHDSAYTLAKLLTIMGNEVRTANDGSAALDVAAAFRPDLILLDIGMPKLNGYEACRRIREQPWGKTAVLIALTGWGQDEDKRQAQEAGFDHHMVKPVNLAAIEKLLAESKPTALAV